MGCKAGSGLRRKVCVIYDCLPVSRSCSGTRCCVRSRRARGPRTVRLDDGSAGDPLPRPRPGPEPADTGLLLSLGSLGGIVGGVLSGRLSRLIGSARIIWVSVGVFGLIPILMPLTERGPRLVLFPIALAGLTFTFVVYNIAQLSYRQLICPPDLLGRMNAAIRWIVWGTLPLGGLIGGALGSTLGIRATLWIGVVGAWMAALWLFFSPLRKMRDIPEQAVRLPAASGEQDLARV